MIKSYLKRVDGYIVERPQYMFMRVAVGIFMEDIESALEVGFLRCLELRIVS